MITQVKRPTTHARRAAGPSSYLVVWLVSLSLALASAVTSPSAYAAGGSYTFSYGGRLIEPNGRPVEGPVSLSVSFYQAATGGSPTLTVTNGLGAVPLQEGVFQFSIVLSGSDFHAAFPSVTQAVYIEITDLTNRPDAPYDRQLVTIVPYAAKVPVDGTTLEFNSQGELTLKSSAAGGATAISAINAASSGTIAPARLPALGGDLSGNLDAATVVKLQGRPVSATAPNNDEFLKWNGTSWIPAAIAGGAGGTVTSIATGQGLSGGPITTSGTIDLRLNASGGLSKTLGAGSNELGIASGGVALSMLSAADGSCSNGKILKVAGGAWTCADDTSYTDAAARAAAVENALNNGTTDKAPSQDAVFDALAGKQATITAATDLTAGSFTSSTQGGVSLAPFGTNPGETGELRLKELAATGTNFVGFKAPDDITASKIWTLPAADGSGGQVLSTNGSGVLSWASAAADTNAKTLCGDGEYLRGDDASTVCKTAAEIVSDGGGLSSVDLSNAAVSNILPASKGGTGVNSTATFPASGVIVTEAGAQTLTNKTLTAPVMSSIVNTGTLTLPSSTDTLVGRATTDTLTNKTLTAPVISSIVNTGTLTLPTSSDTLVGRATTDTLTNKTINGSSNTITNVSLTTGVTGTLAVTNGGTGAASTSQNYVFAGPTSGAGAPDFRALVAADYPAMVGDSGSGGTRGAAPAPGTGDAAAGKFLKADGTWSVPSASVNWAVPGTIGSTTPNTGSFTTLNTNGATVLKGAGATSATAALNVTDSGNNSKFFVRDDGNVGIGTTSPQSTLDVEGSATIGATYSGTTAAPSNGLLVEGAVRVGTTVDWGKFAVDTGSTSGYAAYIRNWNNSNTVDVVYIRGEGTGRAAFIEADNTAGTGTALEVLNRGTGLSFRVNDETSDGTPFVIDASGNAGIGTTSPTKTLDVNANSIRVRTAKTPASATAACDQGEIAWDANFIYVCVATNSWTRAAMGAW